MVKLIAEGYYTLSIVNNENRKIEFDQNRAPLTITFTYI